MSDRVAFARLDQQNEVAELRRELGVVTDERDTALAENERLSGINTGLVRDFNAMLRANARAESERDALSAVIDKVRAECDASEALGRRIWDEMDDYADIGHPKGPFPGRTQVSVDAIRSVLAAGLAAPVGETPDEETE